MSSALHLGRLVPCIILRGALRERTAAFEARVEAEVDVNSKQKQLSERQTQTDNAPRFSSWLF